jgi:hypothetical protein
VSSRTVLCDGPIPRPDESYRLWCVTVCDLEVSGMRQPQSALGCCPRWGVLHYMYSHTNFTE